MSNKWIKTLGISFFAITITFIGVCLADTGMEVEKGTINIEGKTETQFPSLSKINPTEAIRTALSKVNGKVLKIGLENENNFLVYGVEIVTDNQIVDVKLDAGSGEVLVIEKDHPDEKNDQEENDDQDDA